jgi:hypothetical protein
MSLPNPQAMLLVQKAEYAWPGANNAPRFTPAHPVTTLEGDKDVFGDGSVTILSTPGHTPGHQSTNRKFKATFSPPPPPAAPPRPRRLPRPQRPAAACRSGPQQGVGVRQYAVWT